MNFAHAPRWLQASEQSKQGTKSKPVAWSSNHFLAELANLAPH